MSAEPHRAKRVFDFLGSLSALVVLSPVFLVVSLVIYSRMGMPIFFKQERPGINGRVFTLFKFRTMTDATDDRGNLRPDSERLTRLGRFLRATTLDEIPELINVLRGDMSLVGPRPLLLRYLDRYTPEQARRHEVKPGLTGWAVVKGRNAISWEEKFNLDVWYVDNQSFLLDIKILFMTVWLILSRKGVSQAGHATMPEFMGTPESSAPK